MKKSLYFLPAFLCLNLKIGFAYANSSFNLQILSPENFALTSYVSNSERETIFLSPPQKSTIKLAQVCWIVDAGKCLGISFSWSDKIPGKSDNPEDFTPKGKEDCIKEGYTLTSCPEDFKPNKYCLYNRSYFAECVLSCPSDYKTCEDPYYGVGDDCGGKYKECQCDECEGFDYTADNIPDGYVVDGEACNSCYGEKYKIKVNPCDGFLDCGSLGGMIGADSCLSGSHMMYSECRPCPYLGEYDVCPEGMVCAFEECSNLWYATGCATGYDYFCKQPQTDCATLGYKQASDCNGKILKCPYNSAFVLCVE